MYYKSLQTPMYKWTVDQYVHRDAGHLAMPFLPFNKQTETRIWKESPLTLPGLLQNDWTKTNSWTESHVNAKSDSLCSLASCLFLQTEASNSQLPSPYTQITTSWVRSSFDCSSSGSKSHPDRWWFKFEWLHDLLYLHVFTTTESIYTISCVLHLLTQWYWYGQNADSALDVNIPKPTGWSRVQQCELPMAATAKCHVFGETQTTNKTTTVSILLAKYREKMRDLFPPNQSWIWGRKIMICFQLRHSEWNWRMRYSSMRLWWSTSMQRSLIGWNARPMVRCPRKYPAKIMSVLVLSSWHQTLWQSVQAAVGQVDYVLMFFPRRTWNQRLIFDSLRLVLRRSGGSAQLSPHNHLYKWNVWPQASTFKPLTSCMKDGTRLSFRELVTWYLHCLHVVRMWSDLSEGTSPCPRMDLRPNLQGSHPRRCLLLPCLPKPIQADLGEEQLNEGFLWSSYRFRIHQRNFTQNSHATSNSEA